MDKRYDHLTVEKEVQELWELVLPYKSEDSSEKKRYSIDTPPPTVSGSLHIGHIFSYTQTDLIARYKRMQGYNVFYPMGFDDNGLATERFVEKKHKIRGHLLKRSEFITLCLQESKEMAQVFSQLWKTMGLSIDWTRVYSTISDRARKVSQYSFIELYKKNLVYKQEEPALYCTSCRTTVAQAELDSADISSQFNDIVFKTHDGQELVVATTRPELLPACVAMFYHPDDDRYKLLAGKKAITPVFGREVPILADESVDPEKGTGLVMCCTFGDQTDVAWYKKHKLPFVQVIGRDGKWTEVAGPLAGLRVHEARKKVQELLQEAGLLRDQKAIKHPVNVHERCKQEIEYLVLNQWFVKILENREKFLELADKISWKPEFMKARYKDWVENLSWDWCISRQRFYGVQFPVWYCGDCHEVLLADENDLPVDPQEQVYPGGSCPKCSGTNIIPETDVMDTWNTSSLTPQINCNWPEVSVCEPMSLRPQAHDIIRTWAFYTIIKSFYHHGMIPWNDIAISGYVVAKGREKISKSKGNAPTDPEQLLKTFPADAIRYWSACGRLGVDTQFSENQFKIGQRLLTKLWNAFRFCKDQIEAHDKKRVPPKLDELNEWLLHHLNQTVIAYKKHFEAYEHTAALEIVERFFWHIFCDNYLELVKDRIFNPDKYREETIRATRYTMYETCFGILQLFAPFVPHVTEKLYQLLFAGQEGAESLHVTLFDEKRLTCDFAKSAELVDRVVAIVGFVRKLKSEQQLSLKVELARLTLHVTDETVLEQLKIQENVVAGATQAKKVVYVVGFLEEPSLVEEDGAWVAKVMV
ncbi:valine--tRNA ligase [Candidatus Dependentiae bacterium]|nr:valine--tRNA ligase [Candidatus Dependentiae bacterium]